MRIDFTQAVTQADLGNVSPPADAMQRRIDAPSVVTISQHSEPPKSAVSATKAAIPEPNQLNVSVDDKQNVIYRFTDPSNGEVVRQVPPEQILRIMRNIEDLLHESEQKLKVTL
jgi:hypothetical protein